jgi:signal transduction histidine kinase/PAS domain-containing protein
VAFSPQKRQFATIFEDITKRKLAEEELRKAKDELDLRVKERTIELIETNQKLKNEIVERKLAEQVTQLEREKLKSILDIMPGGVYIINRNCDIEYVNPYMEKEFGALIGQKCYQYFHDRSESCPWCMNDRIWSGDSLKWDWYFEKVNKTFELFDTPLHNADGTISKLEIFHDITARKEAEEKARQRNRELTAINEIGRAITSTMDLHKLLAELLNHVRGVVEAQLCTVGLIDAETEDVLFYQLISGNKGVELIWEQRFTKGEGISGWVIEHKQSILLEDVSQDPRPKIDYYQQQDFHPRSMASIPLIAQDVVIGTIGLFHEQPKWFDTEDIRLLEAVAAQAAVVIQNARLFEAEQQARKTADVLRSTALALSKSLNIHTVLGTLIEQIRKVVPFESAHAYLMDDQYTAVVRVAHGEELWDKDDRLLNQRIEIGSLPLLQPLMAGEVISIPNMIDQAELAMLANPKYINSWLGIPLLSEGQVIGICTLEHSNPAFFTDDLIHWAKALTNQAEVAIQNAWLFEQVREGRERLQALSRRLVDVQESERRYISRELHDEAGQTLASLMVGLHLLEREASDQPAIIQHCKDLKQIANTVMEDIHRLAIDLRPASLDRVGLVAALQQHSERISDLHNLTIQFQSVGNVKRLHSEVETAIYRIVQEALTNIIRHAKANRADVLLDWRSSSLVVIVEDNGIGFEPVTPDANHLGMVGMRERADMLGGNIIIESSHGRGSSIFLEVPYVYSHIDR